MALLGVLTSWIAVLLAACAFGVGIAGTTGGAHRRLLGERCLAGSAVAAAIATASLVQLLLAGDVTVTYVARTITTNLPAGYRVAALWQLPSGSALPTAALAALAGGIAASRARTSLGIAVVGAVVMSLLATSLAARPFASLPWVPGDGLGLAPALQHPLSVAAHVAITIAVAVSAAATAIAADGSTTPKADDARPGPNDDPIALLGAAVIALLAWAGWCGGQGAFATGATPSPATLGAFGGMLAPPLVAAALALQRQGDGAARLATWLGTLGLLARVLFRGAEGASESAAMRTFALVSLGAVAIGAMATATRTARAARSARDGDPGRVSSVASVVTTLALSLVALLFAVLGGRLTPAALSSGGVWWWIGAAVAALAAALSLAGKDSPRVRAVRASYAIAVACVAIAAAGEGGAATVVRTVASGGRITVPLRSGSPVSLTHQGISQFEDENAHVAAVALEPVRDGRARTLLSPDRRQYVDSRDEILAPPLARPAVDRFPFEELRIVTEDFGADQQVRLRITVVPFASLWAVAALFVTGAFIARLVTTGTARRHAPPATRPLDPHVTTIS